MEIKITKIIVCKNREDGLYRVWFETNLPNILGLGEEYLNTHPYSLFGVMQAQSVYKHLETTFKDVPHEIHDRWKDKDPGTYGMWDITVSHKLNPEYVYGKYRT